ncbi:FAD-dependent oxidoreductase [Amycolatopsis sp. CA-230715]|uniref:FAD-dependent oxidoreductase n=1 Tax=Amycolatopsis sp. CA-230715 TaxID=2745196 RepID=UPI001C00C800|nr:NAD(P)/FAD-dependent oxidoreductase [Amycolatopsis sp. CA-230715]QWF76697.1 FAD-dependent urate hydroxylase [Amycolatopsis sp. CA-230715]
MTTAAVIGGGIAGTATAIALLKAGIGSTVYEAYPTGADDAGAFLTLMHNGMDALAAIDAHEVVAAKSFATNEVEFSYDGGALPVQPIGSAREDLLAPRTIRRADLHRVLHDEFVRRGGTIAHGKRLASFDGGVCFTDGTRAEADFVVGADGIHSAARRLIDPDAPEPRYAGLAVVYGYAPAAPHPAPPATYRMIQGATAFFGYTTDPGGTTWWFARLPGAELTGTRETTPARWRERAAARFDGDRNPAAEIIRATGEDVFGGNAYDVPTTPRWSSGAAVLVGDAAHAASPAAGQGASMALEDSVVLAMCLRDEPARVDAFRRYEEIRRARVERLVAVSGSQGAGRTTSEEARRRETERAWLYGHHLEWSSPITASPR